MLRDLQLGSKDALAPFGGVRPRPDQRWHYQGLDLPVGFTGRLLVGDGELDDRPYLNMGFWPAWMYPEVRELTLRDGALLSVTDCSAELAEVRAAVLELGIGPDEGEPSRDWIERTFSLSYDYSWPGRRSTTPDLAGQRAASAWPPRAGRRRPGA